MNNETGREGNDIKMAQLKINRDRLEKNLFELAEIGRNEHGMRKTDCCHDAGWNGYW